MNVVVVDYGLGNLHSIRKALHRIGIDAIVSSKFEEISNAEKLILPGVGHFKIGMKNLEKLGLIEVLNKKVIEDKVPILGICLGMQLLGDFGEEGGVSGLGWIKAKTVKLDLPNGYRIPHIGWNEVRIIKKCSIFDKIHNGSSFYFVHSYTLVPENMEEIVCETSFGKNFVSSVQKRNIFGVQFHPEKSHSHGLALLKNFVENV